MYPSAMTSTQKEKAVFMIVIKGYKKFKVAKKYSCCNKLVAIQIGFTVRGIIHNSSAPR